MGKYIILPVFLLFSFAASVFPQNEKYIVKRSSFSSGLTDEFSPVFYGDGIVFCSNINNNSLVSYRNEANRLFTIWYSASKGSGWKQPVLLSAELTSGFNDGPATFNSSGDIVFFCRNNTTGREGRKLSDSTNKLGIYYAVLRNGKWTDITPFPYNDPEFVFATPSLSPDGRRLYFASDKPGGYGKMDLYYCDSIQTGWSPPVNMGSLVNTDDNESFPYADRNGRLFFASDAAGGLGGKDLYYTFESSGSWFSPIHLPAPLNSEFDDFGIVTDSTIANGFFSSNRFKSDDILSFSTLPEEFESCDTLRENRYCFTLFDEHNFTDTIPVEYVWDFGDGVISRGKEVKHCFPGPGKYKVVLNIFDALTRDTITKGADYEVVLEENDMPHLKSANLALTDKSMKFNGLVSGLKSFSVSDFYWDFGDGFIPGGPAMEHVYRKAGEYTVRLGLTGSDDGSGEVPKKCVEKKIRIYDSFEAERGTDSDEAIMSEIRTLSETQSLSWFKNHIFFADDLSSRQKLRITSALRNFSRPVTCFGKNGFDESSRIFLKKVADILKENSNIRIEMLVHVYDSSDNLNPELSDACARELEFWFRNNNLPERQYGAGGMGISDPVSGNVTSSGSLTGFIEFIFTGE